VLWGAGDKGERKEFAPDTWSDTRSGTFSKLALNCPKGKARTVTSATCHFLKSLHSDHPTDGTKNTLSVAVPMGTRPHAPYLPDFPSSGKGRQKRTHKVEEPEGDQG